jgi:hypothetical protein
MVIATRTLKLHDDNGDVEVPIRIFTPEQDESAWKCHYEVEWPDGKFESEGYGQDAVQAILLTFQKIGIELYVSDEHKSGNLMWGEPGKGYGFPVSKTVRDLLIGDDKESY